MDNLIFHSPITDKHLAVSGRQWNENLAGKYGAENVEWVGQIDSYCTLRTQEAIGQAHHLNQDAAYGEVVPTGKEYQQNAKAMPLLMWALPIIMLMSHMNQYRPGGKLYGDAATNLEYTKAVADSLRTAGKNESEVRQAVSAAIQQRVNYGLLGGNPNKLNQVQMRFSVPITEIKTNP